MTASILPLHLLGLLLHRRRLFWIQLAILVSVKFLQTGRQGGSFSDLLLIEVRLVKPAQFIRLKYPILVFICQMTQFGRMQRVNSATYFHM